MLITELEVVERDLDELPYEKHPENIFLGKLLIEIDESEEVIIDIYETVFHITQLPDRAIEFAELGSIQNDSTVQFPSPPESGLERVQMILSIWSDSFTQTRIYTPYISKFTDETDIEL